MNQNYLIAVLTIALLAACGGNPSADDPSGTNEATATENTEGTSEVISGRTVQPEEFRYGVVTYQSTAEALSDTTEELAEAFRAFGAKELKCYFSPAGFRIDEVDGGNNGHVFKNFQTGEAFFISKDGRTEEAVATSIDELDDETKALMQNIYTYELEKLGEGEDILGFPTLRYKVVRSGFIRSGSDVEIWVAPDLHFPLLRFDFNTDNRRIVSPLPLSLGISEGAVLKTVSKESGVMITYSASSLEKEPEASVFRKP